MPSRVERIQSHRALGNIFRKRLSGTIITVDGTGESATMTAMGKLRFPAKARDLLNLMHRAHRCDSGATAIEYSLVATLVAVAIVAGLGSLGTSLTQMYAVIQSAMH